MAVHAFTSVISNYIPKARVLAQSLKRLHPEIVFHLVLSDVPPAGFRVEDEPFDSLIDARDLQIENFEGWVFQHSVVEVSTAVKGPAICRILDMHGCSEALYFDPDIVILSKLDGLIAEFTDSSVLLTPHLTAPETTVDAILDNEFSVLRHGIYNLGFVGVKNSQQGRAFATWWRDRLLAYCFDDIPRGIFTDQRWVDIAPAVFAGIKILRSPAYNVATWNLTHRTVAGGVKQGLTVNGQPLVFYHFSGVDSGAQEGMLKKYGSTMPALFELREWYIAESDRMGQQEFAGIPWAYANYENGEPVTRAQRTLYRDREDLQRAFPNPFLMQDPSRSYWHWYMINAEAERRLAVTKAAGLRRRWSGAPVETPYRIFVYCDGASPTAVAEGARRLRRHSWRNSGIYLIGSEASLARVTADPELRNAFQTIGAEPGSGAREAFAMVVRRFAEQDILFAHAGMLFPELWDLRLCWSANRRPGVATVSPLCELDPLTSLDPGKNWIGAADERHGVDQIDKLCYQFSEFQHPELPGFLEECVYVRGEAARTFLADANSASVRGAQFPERFVAVTKALRYSQILADHVFLGAFLGTEAARPRDSEDCSRRPDPRFARTVYCDALRQAVRGALGAERVSAAAISGRAAPRQLHIMHSWGGGLDRWVREYCAADRAHENYVLKSIGAWGAFGMQLSLFGDAAAREPLQTWQLSPAIPGTAEAHAGYRAALEEILDRFGISSILVSSLVGHSLDALRADVPAAMVCHDYYPFCPALNITFDGLCRQCGMDELSGCTRENPHHRFFLNQPPSAWSRLRESFRATVLESGVLMIAPSPSVRENYVQLVPEFEDRFRVIPHGTSPLPGPALPGPSESGRLKVVVLGSLARQKGAQMLERMLPELAPFADLYLLGAGEEGRSFDGRPGVTYHKEYALPELRSILASIRPDVGLLLSLVPETFSYTLQELFEVGIPPVATRVGSFADRIDDGVNGFLCDTTAESALAVLKRLAGDRPRLAAVSARLRETPVRRIEEMLADYEQVVGTPRISASAYFAREAAHVSARVRGAALPEAGYAQLYWSSARGGFAESNSATAAFPCIPGRQKVTLPIPSLDGPAGKLRFDPASRAGFVVFHGLRLLDGGGQPLFVFELDELLFSGRQAAEIIPLGPAPAPGSQVVFLNGEDPSITIDLPPAVAQALQAGGKLEWDFAWMEEEAVSQELAAKALQGGAFGMKRDGAEAQHRGLAQPALARSMDVASRIQIENLAKQLDDARVRNAEFERSLSWRVTLPLRKLLDIILALVKRNR